MQSKALKKPVKTVSISPPLSRTSHHFLIITSRQCCALKTLYESRVETQKTVRQSRDICDYTLFFHIFSLNLGEDLLADNFLCQFYNLSVKFFNNFSKDISILRTFFIVQLFCFFSYSRHPLCLIYLLSQTFSSVLSALPVTALVSKTPLSQTLNSNHVELFSWALQRFQGEFPSAISKVFNSLIRMLKEYIRKL